MFLDTRWRGMFPGMLESFTMHQYLSFPTAMKRQMTMVMTTQMQTIIMLPSVAY